VLGSFEGCKVFFVGKSVDALVGFLLGIALGKSDATDGFFVLGSVDGLFELAADGI